MPQGDDSDLELQQDASVAGRFVRHWKLRKIAQRAASKEIAKSKLRGPSAQKKSLGCADAACWSETYPEVARPGRDIEH